MLTSWIHKYLAVSIKISFLQMLTSWIHEYLAGEIEIGGLVDDEFGFRRRLVKFRGAGEG